MLYAGSDDGVYRVPVAQDETATRVLDAERVYRVRQFDALDGLFAASQSGLYHATDGGDWRDLDVPEDAVYSVVAAPSGDRLYAGTRPAHVYAADTSSGLPTGAEDWQALEGFEALREKTDWGLPRHDGKAQIRSLCTHPDAPERLVAGLEVGGVFVSDDRGETWTGRHVEGFDVPHPGDVHHLSLGDSETFVAATGSGLFRSTDAGRNWTRLDTGHSQQYFREAFVQEGIVYAGAAHGPSPTWDEDTDHALLESNDGEPAQSVSSPVPVELAIGWCLGDGTVTREQLAKFVAIGLEWPALTESMRDPERAAALTDWALAGGAGEVDPADERGGRDGQDRRRPRDPLAQRRAVVPVGVDRDGSATPRQLDRDRGYFIEVGDHAVDGELAGQLPPPVLGVLGEGLPRPAAGQVTGKLEDEPPVAHPQLLRVVRPRPVAAGDRDLRPAAQPGPDPRLARPGRERDGREDHQDRNPHHDHGARTVPHSSPPRAGVVPLALRYSPAGGRRGVRIVRSGRDVGKRM
jgi:hypothetical protein